MLGHWHTKSDGSRVWMSDSEAGRMKDSRSSFGLGSYPTRSHAQHSNSNFRGLSGYMKNKPRESRKKAKYSMRRGRW